MKNQYFGDINDYRKYGLLRVLLGSDKLKLGVCWLLTPDDGRMDGRFTDYLDKPSKWRAYDPVLFDGLRYCLTGGQTRNVRLIEQSSLLPSATFCSKFFTDQRTERQQTFAEALQSLADADLIFFDPDNGLEVKSVSFGSRDSAKYLYWRELTSAFGLGRSLLIYQHFPRERHEPFIARMADAIQARTDAALILSFCTPSVVFFLAAQAKHKPYFRRQAERVSQTWGDQIRVQLHHIEPG